MRMYQVDMHGKDKGWLTLQVENEKDVVDYLEFAMKNGLTFKVELFVTEGETDAK